MANIISVNQMVDGPRHLHLQIDIVGDGSADETVIIADPAVHECADFSCRMLSGDLRGFNARVEWGGSSPVPIYNGFGESNEGHFQFRPSSPAMNPKTAGWDGKIQLVTDNLGDGERGTLHIELLKKGNP
jgi:hypothetical protein